MTSNCHTASSHRRRAIVGAAIGLAMIALSASPADATMYEKVQHYGGVLDGTSEECGLDIRYHEDYEGTFAIRGGKGSDAGAFFVHDNFGFVGTWTNATEGSDSEGKFFTYSGNYSVHDLRATHVEGTIFEVVSHEVGQRFAVRDMDGNVVFRDRGAPTYTYLFDTEGDDVPGGTFVAGIDFRIWARILARTSTSARWWSA